MTTAPPPEGDWQLLVPGAEAYARGDVTTALRIFQEVARTTAAADVRVGALTNAASMTDHLGDHAAAITLYEQALAAMPEHAPRMRPSLLINMSQALQQVGDYDGATAALEQARALLADNAEFGELRVACLLSLAAVAFHRQQWVYAIDIATEALDAAVRFAPQLAGHPLMSLAASYFETGRRDLAVDFARQALAAFEAAGDRNGIAETQQNLALMLLRTDRLDEAEAPLRASQDYFEQAGFGNRAGVGLKGLAFLAEGRDELDRAEDLYSRSLAWFDAAGAVLEAAQVRLRLATVAFKCGNFGAGEDLLAAAYRAYDERGLGAHCAQIDYWYATLLEAVVDAAEEIAPAMLTQIADIAVPAALAIDAVRYTLPSGRQREQWNRQIADPAMRLAFRFAYLSGNGELLIDLIDTQCAGTTLRVRRADEAKAPVLPLDLLDAAVPDSASESAALQLGSALAGVAAGAGLPVAPPPRLLRPDGTLALADYLAAAEQRYGHAVRDQRVLPA